MKKTYLTATNARYIAKGYPKRFQAMLADQAKKMRKEERKKNAEKFDRIMDEVKKAAEAGRTQVVFDFYNSIYNTSHPLVRRLRKYGFKWKVFRGGQITEPGGGPRHGITW